MEEPAPKTFSSFLLLMAFLLYLIWQISYVWKRRNLYIKSWNIPGPLALPFIGILYKFIWRHTPEDIYKVIEDIYVTHKSVTKVWFGPKLLYLITEPKHVEKILTSSKTLAKDSDFYKHLEFGNSLLTSPVPIWKKHRKAISPAFNQKMLDSFVDVFVQGGEEMNEDLEKNVGTELDITAMISKCNLGILLRTGMGVEKDVRKHVENFAAIIDRIMELNFINIFSIRTCIPIPSFLIPNNPEDEERKILKKRWEDFVDQGTDTTAAALSFTLTMIGIYPEVQQKVFEEMLDILGPDRLALARDLPLMKYTEKVIKETLRLFPSIPFFVRAFTEDFDLGDFVLPSGCAVFFEALHLHRNPDVWEDPLKFDPERFSPENVGKIPHGAYVPFSLGPRNCLGMRYAMMSMKAFLAMVVRKFKFRSDYKNAAEVEVDIKISLKFRAETKLYADKREL